MGTVSIDLPGCKSVSQRALLLAALATGSSHLAGLSASDDTRFLRAALAALGVHFHSQADGRVRVDGAAGLPLSACTELHLGAGGSTLRFLLPLVARQNRQVRLFAAPGLMARPHTALVELLQGHGAHVETLPDGFLVHGQSLRLPSPTLVPVGLSSQFFSGLMMTSGAAAQSWQLDGLPVSPGYLEMTVALLRQFRGAACVAMEGLLWHQSGGFGVRQNLEIPADSSAALFFAVAAALLDSTISFTRAVSPLHPDAYALRFLEEAGFVQRGERSFTGTAPTAIVCEAFDLALSPDSGPAMAVLAASHTGGIRFENAGRLRHKESDRVEGMARLAQACGGEMMHQGESLWIRAVASKPPQTLFDPAADHRLAMAAGVAALRWPGIHVMNPAVVAKSFPDFWNQLDLLR